MNRLELGRMGQRLASTVTAFAEATAWMTDALESSPTQALASATPYLRLFGLAAGGHYLAKGALAALNEGGAARWGTSPSRASSPRTFRSPAPASRRPSSPAPAPSSTSPTTSSTPDPALPNTTNAAQRFLYDLRCSFFTVMAAQAAIHASCHNGFTRCARSRGPSPKPMASQPRLGVTRIARRIVSSYKQYGLSRTWLRRLVRRNRPGSGTPATSPMTNTRSRSFRRRVLGSEGIQPDGPERPLSLTTLGGSWGGTAMSRSNFAEVSPSK